MMRFNHVAVRVDGRHSGTVAAMLTEKLGFVQLRRTERSAWFRQPGTNVDLHIDASEARTLPCSQPTRRRAETRNHPDDRLQ